MDWLEILERGRYGFATLLAISVPPAVVWWFVVHPFVRFWRRLGSKASLVILFVLLVAGMVALFPIRDLLLGRDLGFRPLLAGFGLLLLVISFLIARQRKRHLDLRTLMGTPELEGDGSRLLQEGIYARIRNPRYVEFVLGMLGWSLVLGFVGLYLETLATAVAIHVVVLLEERELRDRFGEEFDGYCRRVPRYVPRRTAR